MIKIQMMNRFLTPSNTFIKVLKMQLVKKKILFNNNKKKILKIQQNRNYV